MIKWQVNKTFSIVPEKSVERLYYAGNFGKTSQYIPLWTVKNKTQ